MTYIENVVKEMGKVRIFALLLLLGFFCLLRGNKVLAAQKALTIPAEFTTSNESKTWNDSIVETDLTYGDEVKKLSADIKVKFELYVPKSLLSKKKTILTIEPVLDLFDKSWEWEMNVHGKYQDINIRKQKNSYKAMLYDSKSRKEIASGKYVKVSEMGKYIKISVSKYPMASYGYTDANKKKSIKGKKKKLSFKLDIVAGVKKSATIYLDNTGIMSGSKTLYSSSHNKDSGINTIVVNRKKESQIYVSTFSKNKIPKFKKVPDDIRNADSKSFVSRTSKNAITNTIPDSYKEKAKTFETASYQNLPKWHGMNLTNMFEASWYGAQKTIPYFTESLIKEISKEGFNFVRVTLDTRIFLSQRMYEVKDQEYKGTGDKVNLNSLRNIDDLIKWGIQYGIHICLDVHNTPGGYMIGGDEEASRELLFTDGSKEQKIYYNFWTLMATRYKDISTNALSFNLYNEPPSFASDKQWTGFMKKAIDIVHGIDESRLLFVDMLDYSTKPVYGLVGEKIVQSCHIYDPADFTHANYDLINLINHLGKYTPKTYNYNLFHGMIENRVREISDFREETGTTVMVQEFGCTNYSYMKDIVSYVDDILTLLDENNLSWAAWAYDTQDFGYISSALWHRAKGGTYVKIGDHRYVSKELREVYKKHMS